jgi:tetratricopeptide (TPR) repeat protein
VPANIITNTDSTTPGNATEKRLRERSIMPRRPAKVYARASPAERRNRVRFALNLHEDQAAHRPRDSARLSLLCHAGAAAAGAPADEQPQPRQFSLLGELFAYGFVLQIAAAIHWARRRPDTFWLWIIIIGGFIGALAYFLIEGPDFGNIGRSLKGPGRRRRIRMLRALILDNPSAGNYEELGELLLLEKRYAEAREAYDHALAARTDHIDPFYRRALASSSFATTRPPPAT